MITYTCPECGKSCRVGAPIINHMRLKHGIDFKQFLNTNLELFREYEELSRQNLQFYRENSPLTPDFYTSRGMSHEDAKKVAEQKKQEVLIKRHSGDNAKKVQVCGVMHEELSEINRLKYGNSLESLILKFGEDVGRYKYELIQTAMSGRKEANITNIMKHSECSRSEAVQLRNKAHRVCSPRTLDYWVDRGYSEEDATLNVSRWQRQQSARTIQYWINKGYAEEEAKIKVSEYQDFSSIPSIMKRLNCSEQEALDIRSNILDKMAITKIKKGMQASDLVSMRNYSARVRKLTNDAWKKYSHILDPDGKGRSALTNHIDHKYSVLHGFLNEVPPEVLCCLGNLQLISREENLKKYINSIITIEELYSLYESEKGTL